MECGEAVDVDVTQRLFSSQCCQENLQPKSIDKGRRYKRRKETKGKKVVSSLVFQEEVDAGAEQVNTAEGPKAGKAPMILQKTLRSQKEHILQEEASLLKQSDWIFTERREERARAKEISHDQSLLMPYMMYYLKNQETWKLSQRRIYKDAEPAKKSGKRREQMARKGLHTDLNKDDSEDTSRDDLTELYRIVVIRLGWMDLRLSYRGQQNGFIKLEYYDYCRVCKDMLDKNFKEESQMRIDEERITLGGGVCTNTTNGYQFTMSTDIRTGSQGVNELFGKDFLKSFPAIHQPSQAMSTEMLQARENLMNDIQAFLKEYDRIPPKEKCMALTLAGERFLKLKQILEEGLNQPEKIQELMLKLLNDLKILNGIQLKKEEQAAKICTPYWKCPIFDDDDDDDEERSIPLKDIISELPLSIAITPDFPIMDSLIMEDEHLDTIPKTESNEENKSSVEDPNLTPSESADLSDIKSKCDVPVCDDFTTFSNHLFDSNDDFTSSDDELLFDEDVPKENFKIYSNSLFDEEIISTKIDPHHFNAESDLIEYLLNQDTSIVSYPKFDSLLEEFSGELAHIDLISPEIDEADFDPEE
ncbi:hypothetical protein Tco_1166043 [Tanacetum coccineum]